MYQYSNERMKFAKNCLCPFPPSFFLSVFLSFFLSFLPVFLLFYFLSLLPSFYSSFLFVFHTLPNEMADLLISSFFLSVFLSFLLTCFPSFLLPFSPAFLLFFLSCSSFILYRMKWHAVGAFSLGIRNMLKERRNFFQVIFSNNSE